VVAVSTFPPFFREFPSKGFSVCTSSMKCLTRHQNRGIKIRPRAYGLAINICLWPDFWQ
jgi:hypothetical protein